MSKISKKGKNITDVHFERFLYLSMFAEELKELTKNVKTNNFIDKVFEY